MGWDDYRFFMNVAHVGTLSGAARLMNITQPTVSRRLALLERRVGPLFDREAMCLTLTPLGQELLPFVKVIDEQCQAIDRCVRRTRSGGSATVRVATTLGLATHWLTPKAAALSLQTEEVTISIQVGIGFSDLLHRQADIALRMGSPADDRLVGRRVGRVACGLYAASSYLERRGEPDSTEELASFEVIESDGEISDLVQVRELRKYTASAPVSFRADNVTIQLEALERGLGLATIPCFMAEPSRSLRRVLREEFEVSVDLWLLVNPALKDHPPVRRVIDYLDTELKIDAPRFEGRASE